VRLYIAGPMTGLPEFNFPAFWGAQRALEAAGYTVRNPARHGTASTSKPWVYYMRRGLRDVTTADGVAVLDGWWRSRGAMAEVQVARVLELTVEPVGHWLETGAARVTPPGAPAPSKRGEQHG
jgi:hypothetical protein